MKKVILLLLLAGLAGCFGKKPEKTALKGKPMPSFNLLLPDSITYFNTNSIPSGKPIVLFYFGPHCPYSRAQMDEIIEEMSLLKDIQFYIFTRYPYTDFKNFYEHYELKKYPNITAGVDYNHFFTSYFKIRGVPYVAIYGKNKRLKEVFIGKIYANQIKEIADE